MTPAMKGAVEWLREHGGECVRAKSINGGLFYLAQGEVGPFMMSTMVKLLAAGLVERVPESQMKKPAPRYRLTEWKP
jgi:hypothetical protein